MPWSKYDHDNEFNLFGCGDDFANSLVVGRGESDTDADGEHMDTLAEGVVTEGNSWRSRDPFHVRRPTCLGGKRVDARMQARVC